MVPRNRIELLTRGFSDPLSGYYKLQPKNTDLQLKTEKHTKNHIIFLKTKNPDKMNYRDSIYWVGSPARI